VAGIARAEGAERLIVATTNDDLPALGLYQRLGFTITQVLVGKLLEHHGGVELGFAGIPVRDEIQLELRL
jgi:ribosomal protein S18 acetylase RimI-like enzyme